MLVVWLSQVLFKTFCSIIPFNFVNLGKRKNKEFKSILWSSQTKWVSQHTNLKRLISKLVFFMLWLFYLFLKQMGWQITEQANEFISAFGMENWERRKRKQNDYLGNRSINWVFGCWMKVVMGKYGVSTSTRP